MDIKLEKGILKVNPTKEIIEYFSSRIYLQYRNRTGSLYKIDSNLFETTTSQFFTINELITQLEKAKDISIIDYMVNLMHEKYLNESFFYLSQLCMMIIYKNYTISLEKYILDKCYNHLKFSIFVTLLLKSFPPLKTIQSMNFHIEEIMLSNNNQIVNQPHLGEKRTFNREFMVTDKPTLKESRVHYYYRCLEFYDNLRGICLLLFNYPIKKEDNVNKITRNQALEKFIHFFNVEMENIRKENYMMVMMNKKENIVNEDLIYNKGFLLPFSNPKSDLDCNSYIIVNIIPEYSFCFNTKARVPIKLCCECIELEECDNFYSLLDDPQFLAETNNNNNNDTLNIHNSVSLEVNKQLSFFQSKQTKIFDKWANLEKFIMTQKEQNAEPNSHKKSKENKEPQFLINNTEDDFVVVNFNPENFNPFGQPISKIYEEIKSKSKFKNFKTLQIKNFIAKANDDLKQEMFAMQLIKIFDNIFKKLDIYVSTYEILITSSDSGLIEFVPNTNSVDGILKAIPGYWNLNKFFRNFFHLNFKQAQLEFANSLAGFCLLSYYLQIKDRHNGNILLDDKGRISHIDFGFILGASPKNLYFEKAEFKLTQDYVDILDGFGSPMFNYFKSKLVQGIIECKKNYEILSTIIRIMSHSNLNCYQAQNIDNLIKEFQAKFLLGYSETKVKEFVDKIVQDSYENFWTKKYDYFQYLTNNIKY